MFIVAGASGNVGSATVRKLVESGSAIVKALTRSSASNKVAPLKELPNVEIVECDLMDKSNLANAFTGVKAAFLACSNTKDQVEAEKNFIECAIAAGVTYLVKLGTVRSYTSMDSPVEYARYHAEIEEYLENRAGAMKWTVLSPNWFMSNHLGDIFGTLPMGMIVYPVGPEVGARIIDPRDVGEAAAHLLLASDPSAFHKLKLDMSGPEEISMEQIAKLYTEALGRPIRAVNCPLADWIASAMKNGFADWLAEAVSKNFEMWQEGKLAFPTSPELLTVASPKRSMSEWVKEWAPRSPPPTDS